jgi:uncharacterized protein YqfB (UPF0267 family)
MKKIGDIISNFEYRAPFVNPNEPENEEVINEEDRIFINYVFKEIKAICSSYHTAWPNQEIYNTARRSWLKAFKLANVNDSTMIEVGLNTLRLRSEKNASFVPTSGQFIDMCRGSPNEVKCRIPFYVRRGIESDELKEKRKNDAKRHLSEIKELLK